MAVSERDLPDFGAPVSVRRSARAKRVSFNVSRGGLEVVVPHRLAQRHIPSLVMEQRSWIEAALERAREQFGGFTQPTRPPLPEQLELRALNELLSIIYTHRAGRTRVVERESRLLVNVPVEGGDKIFHVLHNYLRERARAYFSSRLDVLSTRTGLPYKKLCVRGQRRRWGSYSATGTVNLNYKLLFLPAELVDHVLLHELCHAKYLNHSARFWALLESHDPNSDSHRRALHSGDRSIPEWVEYRA